MTFGKNEAGELVFTLSPKEAQAFLEGQEIVKQSGDSQGRFSVKMRLKYAVRRHRKLSTAQNIIQATGEYSYKGQTIRPHPNVGYTLTGHDFYEYLNEALWEIERQVKAGIPA